MSRTGLIALLVIIAATALAILPPRRPADQTTRTTLLFTIWGQPFEDRLFQQTYARGYEKLRPDIAIDYRRYGQELWLKYNAWHALGRGPELMRIRITDYHGMVDRGMLEPLSTYLHDPTSGLPAADAADLPSQLMDILWVPDSTGKPEIYALPEDNSQYGLYYNPALFDAHNAAHPDDRVEYPNPDWTWADLRSAARKLSRYENDDPRGRLAVRGFTFAVWSWPFMTFFAQAGGRLWSDDGNTCLLNSPEGVETLEFLRAMQRDDRSFEPTFGNETAMGADKLFAAGLAAMFLDGSWRLAALDKDAPGLDFAVSPLPRGKVPAVVSGSVLWAISAHAKHKPEAWDFLKWLIAREQAAVYWDALRVAPPARISVVASDQFKATRGILKEGVDPSIAALAEKGELPPDKVAASYHVPPMPAKRFESRAKWILYANAPHPATGKPPGFVPVGLYQTELENEIQRMLESYLRPTNERPAQEVLDEVVRNIHSLIDRDRAAKGLAPIPR